MMDVVLWILAWTVVVVALFPAADSIIRARRVRRWREELAKMTERKGQ